jgi:membrane protein implicated in regulation of membrane protease activity
MRLLIGIGVTAVLAIVSYLLIAFTKWELCPANWEVPNRATLSILVLVSVFLGWYVYKIKEYNSDLQLGDKKDSDQSAHENVPDQPGNNP